MTTKVRTLTLAVAAVFGATAIALSVGPLDDRIASIGVIASAYAKEEGGSSGGHTSGGGSDKGGSSGGHTSGATGSSSSSGGHTSGGGSDKGGSSGGHTSGATSGSSSSGGHTSGGGSDKGGSSGGHTSGATSGSSSSGGHTSGGGSDKGGSSGGHASGGGESGGGHESGGGGSKGGGPNTASHRYGLERAAHGTKPGHEGHASGVHGANAKRGASSHATGADRRFGGGSGIGGMEQVLEGPARFAENTTLTQTASSDPGPKFRFRYWGGWSVPDGADGDDGSTNVATNTVDVGDASVAAVPIGGGGGPLARLTLNSAARCDDVGQNMPTRAFFTTANLTRLDAALVELDPDAVRAGRGLDPTMMANVQEELVDGRADPALVGSYLGMMSRKPVSAETVKRVAYRLCAPIDDNTASQIARMAEEVRSVASAD